MAARVSTIWFLGGADARTELSRYPQPDQTEALKIAMSLYPDKEFESLGPQPLSMAATVSPGYVFVGAYGRVSVVCSSELSTFVPSKLPDSWNLSAEGGSTLLISSVPETAQGSFALWEDGELRRSFSAIPIDIVENLGSHRPGNWNSGPATIPCVTRPGSCLIRSHFRSTRNSSRSPPTSSGWDFDTPARRENTNSTQRRFSCGASRFTDPARHPNLHPQPPRRCPSRRRQRYPCPKTCRRSTTHRWPSRAAASLGTSASSSAEQPHRFTRLSLRSTRAVRRLPRRRPPIARRGRLASARRSAQVRLPQ